jgi:hypothetical protein
VFKFKKGNKSIQEIQVGKEYNCSLNGGYDIGGDFVVLNSSLKIFNCLTSKYIELVKIDTSYSTHKPFALIKDNVFK